MFSPNACLQFVFANKNDTFYGFESLALDLDRFLWLRLLNQGYTQVYFVERAEDSFCVSAFGDSAFPIVTPEKPKLFQRFKGAKAKGDALCSWILKQLWTKDPDRAAIVFRLKDFCEYFSQERRKEFLTKLASQEKRTGILILTSSAEAEGSKRYFLNAPVFESLGEQSVLRMRTAKPCDMYAVMYREMPERMLFLNVFTAERIHCILSRVLLEEPERTAELRLRKSMEDYLLQWMNNPPLRSTAKKRDELLPSPDVLFRDLYLWLKKNENWNLLASKAMQVEAAGGIQNYLSELGCECVEDPVNAVGIRRSADSYAGRCLRLRLKTQTIAESGEREKIAGLLDAIRTKVLSPRNREENAGIREMIELFLSELPAADDCGDAETVRRLLFSIDFCIDQLHAKQDSPEEAAILAVIEQLKNYIDCSLLYHNRRRNLALGRRSLRSGDNRLTGKALQQLEDEESAALHLLETYEDAVQASIVKLASSPPSTFTELAKSLSEEVLPKQKLEMSDLQDPIRISADPFPKEEPQSDEKNSPEDEDFILIDSDYDINPFSQSNG